MRFDAYLYFLYLLGELVLLSLYNVFVLCKVLYLKSILSDVNRLLIYLLIISMKYLFTFFTYSRCISLSLKWVSSVCSLSYVWLFVTPWTAACQVPLCMEFSRQEYWSGLLFPSQGDLSNPGIKLSSPTLAGIGSRFFTAEPRKAILNLCRRIRMTFLV